MFSEFRKCVMVEKDLECVDEVVNILVGFTSLETTFSKREKDSNRVYSSCTYLSRKGSMDLIISKRVFVVEIKIHLLLKKVVHSTLRSNTLEWKVFPAKLLKAFWAETTSNELNSALLILKQISKECAVNAVSEKHHRKNSVLSKTGYLADVSICSVPMKTEFLYSVSRCLSTKCHVIFERVLSNFQFEKKIRKKRF